MKNYYLSDADFEKFLGDINGIKGYLSHQKNIKKRSFFYINNGWLGLLKNLIKDLIKEGWNKKVLYVKDEWGQLRFHSDSTNEKMRDLIGEAMLKSRDVCQYCGDIYNTPGICNMNKCKDFKN